MSKCNITIVPGSTMNDSRVSLLLLPSRMCLYLHYTIRTFRRTGEGRLACTQRCARSPRRERRASPLTTHNTQQAARAHPLSKFSKDEMHIPRSLLQNSLFQVVDIIACSHSAWICTYVLYAFPPVSSSIHYITMYPTLSDG